MGEIAAKTFGWGGPGFVLFQIMLLGVIGGWALPTILMALGQGQTGNMIKTVSVFVVIGIVFGVVWGVIGQVAKAVGL